MKVEELVKAMMGHPGNSRHRDDATVVIALSSPSMGPIAHTQVRHGHYGFDWERGMFVLTPTQDLVVKSDKEKVWDMAFDHIYMLAQRKSCKGNLTSKARWAREVLTRAGCSLEHLK